METQETSEGEELALESQVESDHVIEGEAAQPARDELKIVIILKANRAMVGIQSPDCDPVFTTQEGDLATTLQQVPDLVDQAKLKWATNPRNPAAPKKEPPPAPPRPVSSVPSSTPKAKPEQPKWF